MTQSALASSCRPLSEKLATAYDMQAPVLCHDHCIVAAEYACVLRNVQYP